MCPVHNEPVEPIKEGNYFLKLEKYREAIRRNIEKNPDSSAPERYRNEALRMLDEPLEDLASRVPRRASIGASRCRLTTSTSPTSGTTRCRPT